MRDKRLHPEDEEYLARTCEASGVPVLITDPNDLDHLAALLRGGGDPS